MSKFFAVCVIFSFNVNPIENSCLYELTTIFIDCFSLSCCPATAEKGDNETSLNCCSGSVKSFAFKWKTREKAIHLSSIRRISWNVSLTVAEYANVIICMLFH